MWPLMSVHAVYVWAFTAKHDRATLVKASELLDCMTVCFSSPRYSCPPCTSLTFSLSLSLSLFNPSFFHYLVWLAVCCSSLISLPSPSQSLSVQACQYSPSFVQLFTSPTHFSTQVFEHTHWYNHTHTHTHAHGRTHIFIPTHLQMMSLPHSSSHSLLKRITLAFFCKAAYHRAASPWSRDQVLPDWFPPGCSYIPYSICSVWIKMDGVIIKELVVWHLLVAF